MTLGIPFKRFVREFGYDDPSVRVADIGCGPVDLLRYLSPDKRLAYYLGVDQSERYLAEARARAAAFGLPSTFEAMDLEHLTGSPELRERLRGLIDTHACTQAMLLGVLHHIGDDDAVATLELLRQSPTVHRVFTWDVVIRPGRTMNNFLARNDRGQHVRDEAGYGRVIARTGWRIGRTFWTHPGLSAIDYLHYELVRP